MPVRKIGTSHRSITGRYNGGRGQRAIAFESSLERDFITLMRFDPDVDDVEEQPLTILFKCEHGKSRRYTPDFLVTYRKAAPILVEVKPKDQITSELNNKFEAAENYAMGKGWAFEVWSEDRIRIPRLENAKLLRRYTDHRIDPQVAAIISTCLRTKPSFQMGHLIKNLWPDEQMRAAALPTLWSMISNRSVICDLDRNITLETVIRLAMGDEDA